MNNKSIQDALNQVIYINHSTTNLTSPGLKYERPGLFLIIIYTHRNSEAK